MSAKLSLKKLSLLIQTSPLLFYEREIKLKYICWQHEIKNTFVTFWNYPLLSRPNVLGSSTVWMCQISNICCFFRHVKYQISKQIPFWNSTRTLRWPCYSLNDDVMHEFDDFFIASIPWKYYDFVLKFQSLTPVWYEA